MLQQFIENHGDRLFELRIAALAPSRWVEFDFDIGRNAFILEIIEGLEGTHKGGTRYPITVAMRDTVTMPKSYQELMKMFATRDASAPDKTE